MNRHREQFEALRNDYIRCKSMLITCIELLQEMKAEEPQNARMYERQEIQLRSELIRITRDHQHNIRAFINGPR